MSLFSEHFFIVPHAFLVEYIYFVLRKLFYPFLCCGLYIFFSPITVEYCWGDASTTWGAMRIADGHPAPYRVNTFVSRL